VFRGLIISGLFLISFFSFGQEIKPNAAFDNDSIKIGESVPYSVWIAYPKDFDVLFPDSLYDFSPFELEHKEYFLTQSDSLTSRDSVVYYLTTFEIDTIQRLQVPLFLVNEFDSAQLDTPIDSIILVHVVTEMPDSVALIVNTSYTKVPLAFNYPYLIIGISAGIIIIIVVVLVFGNSMKRQVRLFRIRRKHKKFIKRFEQILAQNGIDAEPSLIIWKKYMESLTKGPYTKLTTKDIGELVDDDSLLSALNAIDRIIYAERPSTEIKADFEALKEFAVTAFLAKSEEVKNG
jgi:hypothetical protein